MIRKSTLSIMVPALALMATGAMAAAAMKSGEIKSIDTSKHELVLTSGETFELGHGVKASQLKAGTKVSIAYEEKGGKMIASKVQVEK